MKPIIDISSGVYQIKNITTGDYYIGSSCNIRKRIREHRCNLANNKHCNQHLQNAYNKYGEQAFEFNVVLLCDIEHKIYFEQGLLDLLKPAYNLASCALASWQGLKHTDESKRKMSVAQKGKRRTEEQVRKMSEVQKGKHLSDEHVQKIASSNRGKKRSEEVKRKIGMSKIGNTYRRGVKLSDETRERLSLSHLGNTPSEETRTKMSAAQKMRWQNRKAIGVN